MTIKPEDVMPIEEALHLQNMRVIELKCERDGLKLKLKRVLVRLHHYNGCGSECAEELHLKEDE